jgi:hypothetical protein
MFSFLGRGMEITAEKKTRLELRAELSQGAANFLCSQIHPVNKIIKASIT